MKDIKDIIDDVARVMCTCFTVYGIATMSLAVFSFDNIACSLFARTTWHGILFATLPWLIQYIVCGMYTWAKREHERIVRMSYKKNK